MKVTAKLPNAVANLNVFYNQRPAELNQFLFSDEAIAKYGRKRSISNIRVISRKQVIFHSIDFIRQGHSIRALCQKLLAKIYKSWDRK